MEALQELAWGYLQVKLWSTKWLGLSLSRRRHFCMSDDSQDSTIRSASPKKHRIILVPNLLKEAPLPYPSTRAVGIFAIHLKMPFFSTVVSCPCRDSKLSSWLLSNDLKSQVSLFLWKTQREETKQLEDLVKSCQAVEWSIYFPIDLAFLPLRNNDGLIKCLKFPCVTLCLNLCNAKDLRFAILYPFTL